jgi:ribosomal protein S18 acetylase RimI-like enzyme
MYTARKRMEIRIRQGLQDDSQFIAWTMVTAARSHCPSGFWDVAFPDPGERDRVLEKLTRTETNTFCHHDSFLIAEADGKRAAALCGYDPAVSGNDAFVRSLLETGMSDKQLRRFVDRITPLMACLPETPHGTWIIEWVATIPELRGKGVAGRLLQSVIARGADLGFQAFQISIEIGNTPALRAYQKAGFQIVDEKRSSEYESILGAPGIARMQFRPGE